jgi:TolB-like protein
MSPPGFFEELKRRQVYKVAITYAIISWLLLQIASVVMPIIESPDWVMKAILTVLIIGFPVALVLAWAFELSPEGIIRSSSSKAEKNPFPDQKKHPFTSNVLIGVLIMLLIAQYIYFRENPAAQHEPDTKDLSIAVLPLINLGKESDLDAWADGLTQGIIDEIATIHDFTVKAFSMVYPYRGTSVNNKQVAQELDANFILSGSLQEVSDVIRISLALMNPLNGNILWTKTYNEHFENAPKIQGDVAAELADNFGIELSAEEEASLKDVTTSSAEAFQLLLYAKQEFNKLTHQGIEQSIRLLEKALELDSDYAQAHTLLAFAEIFYRSPWIKSSSITIEEFEQIIEPHINRSIELDPISSDVYLVRGNFNLFYKGRIQDAKRDVDYALEINSWPKVPTNYCICTVVSVYAVLGQLDKAWQLTRIGKKVDPYQVFIWFDEAMLYMEEKNYQEAQRLMITAVEMVDIPMLRTFLGYTYYHAGQFEKAIEQFTIAYNRIDVSTGMNTAYLANAYFQLNDLENSDKYYRELIERKEAGENNLNINLASVAASRGDKEETIRLLTESVDSKEFLIAFQLNVDPIFSFVRNDSRFTQLQERLQYFE